MAGSYAPGGLKILFVKQHCLPWSKSVNVQGQVLCSFCCNCDRKAGVDGSHQQMHRGGLPQKTLYIEFTSTSLCRIFCASLERRLWTITRQCGCRIVKRAHVCTAKRSLLHSLFLLVYLQWHRYISLMSINIMNMWSFLYIITKLFFRFNSHW